ncbi:MAG: class I SAM-dependent methyltransferase [Cyclobacteriaceae bacterium]
MISKFATVEEVFSEPFESINRELLELNKKYKLIGHSELNRKRFYWHGKLPTDSTYYGARFWEFPFAILAAELETGLKCADIGCGSTPFTAYLCKKVGKENVVGFDPDHVDENSHSSFGAKKGFIKELGFEFHQNNMTQLDCPDESFDRVFCISVLEHIDSWRVKYEGLQEMVRILKPGGKLILTFDLGIESPLNDILQIIRLSGLTPANNIDLTWPKERFVNYGTSQVDVFGLVLIKSNDEVFLNYDRSVTIPQYRCYEKTKELAQKLNISCTEYLLLNDLRGKFGKLKMILKLLLNRYKELNQ